MKSSLLCDLGFFLTTPAQEILPEALQHPAKLSHLLGGPIESRQALPPALWLPRKRVEPFIFWAEISLILYERQNSQDHNSA